MTDAARFAEIVERTEPAVRRLLGRLCGRYADVDDLVQETYLRAWRGFRKFRGESSEATWVTRIAINVSRSKKHLKRPTVSLRDCVAVALRAAPDARDAAMMIAYDEALSRLSPEHRAVFVLHEAEGLSYQEVADTLGCPIGTVMSRLHRARARLVTDLRKLLEDQTP